MIDLRTIARALHGEVSGQQVLAPGPGHSPRDRSLAINLSATAPDGFIVFSHAGDDWRVCRDHVRAQLGLAEWQPGDESRGKANGHDRASPFVAIYDYTDENGELLFQVCRNPDKTFPQRRPDGKGGWIWKTGDVRKVLYRLPELFEAIASEHAVVIVEGEKDVENLRKIGVPATCSPGGAAKPGQKQKWRPEYSESLRGADIVIVPDHDEPGYAHAEHAAHMSAGIAARVRILELAKHWPECPKGGDISDWLAAGHTREQLDALIDRTSDYGREGAIPDNPSSERAMSWQDPGWKRAAQEYGERRAAQPPIKDIRPPAFSDEALALRFADRHGDELRYVAAWGKWLRWDGTRWLFDETLYAYDLARRVCREVATECNKAKVATAIAAAKTVAAIERLAKADRRHAATVDQWDADIWLCNTPHGVIDMRSGKLRPHKPHDYMTRITGVAPDTSCPTPIWLAFLERVTGNDAELIAFLQRLAGYALTGATSEHALAFLYGTGANGKSTFLNAITGCAGEYHRMAPIETFTASTSDRHPTDLAGLRGARLVTAIETEEGRRWAESKIKALTGGDRIAARFMRQDFFEYVPQFKLVIAGNHKPGLRSVDEAIRRRFHLIPFTVTIPPEERDHELEHKLRAEWPGILAWMIEGCLEWQRVGLAPPKAVTDATAAYLNGEDAIAAWIEDECEPDPQAWEKISDLYISWKNWADRSGEYAGSVKRFGQNLEVRGHSPQRTKAARGVVGLRIKPPSSHWADR